MATRLPFMCPSSVNICELLKRIVKCIVVVMVVLLTYEVHLRVVTTAYETKVLTRKCQKITQPLIPDHFLVSLIDQFSLIADYELC